MANSIDVGFNVDTKQLEKLAKVFTALQKTIKNLKLNVPKDVLFGQLSNYKGTINENELKNFLAKYPNPKALVSNSISRLTKMYNFVSEESFKQLSPKLQESVFAKKFSYKTLGNAGTIFEEMRKQQISNLKKLAKINQSREAELLLGGTNLQKNFLLANVKNFWLVPLKKEFEINQHINKSLREKIKINNKTNAQALKELRIMMAVSNYEGERMLAPYKDKVSELNKNYSWFNKTDKILSKKEKSVSKAMKKRKKDLEKLAKSLGGGYFTSGKFVDDFISKVKTLGLYLSALSLFNFVKDIIQVRKEYQTTAIMLSRTVGNFGNNSQNTQSQNLKIAEDTIKELRSFARYIGLEYGEIEKGFAKLANAVPAGTMSLDQVKNSYKELLKLFAVTGATGDEQTNAIRAFYQMLEKGSLSAEEFNRQLGNTPLRAVVLKYALKTYSEEAKRTLNNFDELQNYLKSKSISAASFFAQVMKEAAKDPNSSIDAYRVSTEAQLNRLNAAFTDFKLSLTGGGWLSALDPINPILGSISTFTVSLTGLLDILTVLMPLLNAAFVIFSLWTTIKPFKNNFIENINKSLKDIQKYYSEGQEQKALEAKNRLLASSFITLGGAIITASVAFANFKDALDDIKEKGFSLGNVTKLITSGLALSTSLASGYEAVRGLKKIYSFIDADTIAAGAGKFLKPSKFMKTKSMIKAGEKMQIAKTAFKGSSNWFSGISAAFGPFMSSIFSALLGPIGITLLGILAMAGGIYAFCKWKKNKEESKNAEVARLSNDTLIIDAYTARSQNYAQVDVRADFPVQTKTLNLGDLVVNIGGNIVPGSNI